MVNEIVYGSLCTGYDGLGMALRLTGVPIRERWFAENDDAMSEVLKREYPDVRNVGDVKVAPWHLAPHTDLMSSGDPCQSISIAGRQAGRDDARFLWPWVRDAYRVVRPGGIFFENVANIVNHDGGRTMAERFAHLREDGYAVRWTVLGACSVGAPHHRHRWYAVAAYVGAGAPEAVRIGTKALCGAPRSGGRALLPLPMARDGNGRGSKESPPLGAVVNLLPTPTTADGAGGPGASGRDGGLNLRTAVTLLPTPVTYADSRNATAGRSPGSVFSPGWTLADVAYADTWGKYAEAITLWESITGVPAPEPTEVSPRGSRRLNPALSEWMMGLRPGLLTSHLSRNDALKGAGNGVVPLAAAAAWRLLTC